MTKSASFCCCYWTEQVILLTFFYGCNVATTASDYMFSSKARRGAVSGMSVLFCQEN